MKSNTQISTVIKRLTRNDSHLGLHTKSYSRLISGRQNKPLNQSTERQVSTRVTRQIVRGLLEKIEEHRLAGCKYDAHQQTEARQFVLTHFPKICCSLGGVVDTKPSPHQKCTGEVRDWHRSGQEVLICGRRWNPWLHHPFVVIAWFSGGLWLNKCSLRLGRLQSEGSISMSQMPRRQDVLSGLRQSPDHPPPHLLPWTEHVGFLEPPGDCLTVTKAMHCQSLL